MKYSIWAGLLLVCCSRWAEAANQPAAPAPAWLRRDRVTAGKAAEVPDGFVAHSLGRLQAEGKKTNLVHLPGVRISLLRDYRPAVIAGTEKDFEIAHLDISDDGQWVLFSSTAEPAKDPGAAISGDGRRLVLCRTDGSGRFEVPAEKRDAQSLTLSGFYRRSPYGAEVFYSRDAATIVAVRVDCTSQEPRFGATRTICAGIAWDMDDQMSVSGNHLHGRLGELSRYVTIPDGGKGTAGPDHLWRFTGKSKFGCAVTLSHDGGLAISNPTQLEKVEGQPDPGGVFPIWHRGFIVLPFKEDREPPLDIAEHYFRETVSANWCAREFRPGNHDFSQWSATNRAEYVVGRQRSRKPDIFGAWLIHWPSNTWTRLTPPDVFVLGPALHFREGAPPRAPERPQGPGANDQGPAPDAGGAPRPGDRPDPKRATIRATLRKASELPTPRSIAPYKQALTFNVYSVDKVMAGACAPKEVLVGHWAIRDSKPLPDARREEGQVYEMTIEPLESHPQLRQMPAPERSGDPNLPVFYEVSQ